MKKAATFPINNFIDFRTKMLNWVKPFNIFCLLDNSGDHFEPAAFECLLAAGSKKSLQINAGKAFEQLKDFAAVNKDWLFGHLAYDLKNETEVLTSNNFDCIGFPDLHFFVPEIVLQLSNDSLSIYCAADAADIFADINNSIESTAISSSASPDISARFTHAAYTNAINHLQQHILRGDCYEVNFCQEFYADNATIDPLIVYQKLVSISPNPFAALYKMNDRYCLCSSPERYLKKKGRQVISQPIKGTAKRFLNNAALDKESSAQLLSSEKEKSENVMVVDLVRNDLSKICKEGSVEVTELFGIYSFKTVHQMISTVSGTLKDDVDWIDVVKASFPMGSMTGAPKKKVMELIEQYEQTRRGLFSGAIGYVTPDGDADFNVVIRSILYNATNKYLSLQAGSAITFYSDPEMEYEECLLKAAALMEALSL